MEGLHLLYAQFMNNNRKRKQTFDESIDKHLENCQRRRIQRALDDEDEFFAFTMVEGVTIISNHERQRKYPRRCNVDRNHNKLWWSNADLNWDEQQFAYRMRINRRNFDFIVQAISPFIAKTPTNFVQNPIEDRRQVALTLYRLAHGCSFSTLSDLFGVSVSLAVETFNIVVRELVLRLYDRFIRVPVTDEEWESELRGFIENYEFPCVGAWDGFHVYTSTKLKNHFSFKKRYSVTNMGLVSYNKRFLHLTVGAPGSTHDARLLKYTDLFQKILRGEGLPNKTIQLEDNGGEIPLVTIGDSAFPRHAWLLKTYNENTRDLKERYFNKKLCSARVVTENAYGMLKGRWRILYKKTDMKLHNVRYVIMACAMLHNLTIETNDPCNPRWKLQVEELSLIDRNLIRAESKHESNINSNKIAEWLWKK